MRTSVSRLPRSHRCLASLLVSLASVRGCVALADSSPDGGRPTLLSATALASGPSLGAVVFQEGFEGDLRNGVNGWTIGDANGSGPNCTWDDVIAILGG